MPACKSGSTSGWTCGVVTADKVTESVNDNGELLDVYGFHFSAFLLSGDSGGAIVSGHYSIGVDSYGNMSSCDDAPMTMRSPVASPSLTVSTTPRRCSSTASTCPSTSDSRSSPSSPPARYPVWSMRRRREGHGDGGWQELRRDRRERRCLDGSSAEGACARLAQGDYRGLAAVQGPDFTTTGAAASRKFTL